MSKKQLWLRWTLANAPGEMLGLGLTFVITGLFFLNIGEQNTTASILLSEGRAGSSARGSARSASTGIMSVWNLFTGHFYPSRAGSLRGLKNINATSGSNPMRMHPGIT